MPDAEAPATPRAAPKRLRRSLSKIIMFDLFLCALTGLAATLYLAPRQG